MLKCDRCAVARFCSQQCQQSNWREHRKECFFATKKMLNAFRCPEMVVQTIDDPEELKPLPHDEGGQLHAKAIQRHRLYKNAQHLQDDDFEFQRQIRQCSRMVVEEAAGWAAVRDYVGAALAYQSGAMMHKAAGHVDMVQRMAGNVAPKFYNIDLFEGLAPENLKIAGCRLQSCRSCSCRRWTTSALFCGSVRCSRQRR